MSHTTDRRQRIYVQHHHDTQPETKTRTRSSLHISRVGPIGRNVRSGNDPFVQIQFLLRISLRLRARKRALERRFSVLDSPPESGRFERRAMKQFMARNPALTARNISILFAQSNEKSLARPATIKRVPVKYAG